MGTSSLSKYRVFSIQTRLLRIRDEELLISWVRVPKVGQLSYLRLIRIRTSICHSYYSSSVELIVSLSTTTEVYPAHLESLSDLIVEWSSPYTLSPFACTCWISTLDHESLDITMKEGIVVCS
jgi:hypothetical protein